MGEPIFAAEYQGDGVWSVAKICPVNPEWDRLWYFYEDSGDLVTR
jgi:hypothetical protein